MWFLNPEQQKEQADLARAVAGPMRAWWRRNRLFWIVAAVITFVLLMVGPGTAWLWQQSSAAPSSAGLLAPSATAVHWFGWTAYVIYLALILGVLIVWWMAALRVNRTLDGVVAESALPHSALIKLVRFEQSLRQGMAPLLIGVTLLVTYTILDELASPQFFRTGQWLRVFSLGTYELLYLFSLPIVMIWGLALLAVGPRKPLVSMLLPAIWAVFNPLSYFSYLALYRVCEAWPALLNSSSSRTFGYIYNREFIPTFGAYLCYFAAGLVLMFLAVILSRRLTWLARALLAIQLALMFFASQTTKSLELWIANPVNELAGGLPLEALHQMGAAVYQPIITCDWQIGYFTPSLVLGYSMLSWEQLFLEHPWLMLFLALAINIAGLLLLKELAGWAVYRAERSATNKHAAQSNNAIETLSQ